MVDERLKENELFQTAHIMILICYTIFATILIGESLLLGWERWTLVLIAAGIVVGWIIHIRASLLEYTRLWIYSLTPATFKSMTETMVDMMLPDMMRNGMTIPNEK